MLNHTLGFAALTGKEFRAEDKRMAIGARNQAIAEKQCSQNKGIGNLFHDQELLERCRFLKPSATC